MCHIEFIMIDWICMKLINVCPMACDVRLKIGDSVIGDLCKDDMLFIIYLFLFTGLHYHG